MPPQTEVVYYTVDWVQVIAIVGISLAAMFTCGYIAGKLGERGDSSFWVFFPLGFYLSILGIIAAGIFCAVMRERVHSRNTRLKSPEIERTVTQSAPISHHEVHEKICPTCHTSLPMQADYCIHCGSELRKWK